MCNFFSSDNIAPLFYMGNGVKDANFVLLTKIHYQQPIGPQS
jgi:hypothetical protein